jgi:hypothetical protein
MKLIKKYVLPLLVLGLLLGFLIYGSVKQGFLDFCVCPKGSQLRNGGCLTCPEGYRLSTDYYNSHCVSTNPNDYNTPKYITGVNIKKLDC